MTRYIILAFCSILLASLKGCQGTPRRPHIIYVLADDLGWTDVSHHGSKQIPTPNIDAMAYAGILLGNYYTQPICTPTRAAILTGRHPIHLGMQHFVIRGPEPYGLGLDEKLLPEYLKELGYSTHLVGKWHLGFNRMEYTPLRRGFDTFYGHYSGQIDYWDHSYSSTFWGLDWHRNWEAVRNETNGYSTFLLTKEAQRIIETHDQSNPLFLFLSYNAPHRGNVWNPRQAPSEFLKNMMHIKDRKRRELAGVISALDHSFGELVQTLHDTDMLKDCIFVFSTDNGGQSADTKGSAGCNFPLRGMKGTMFEGGVRGTAFIWSPFLQHMEYTSNHLMEVADWLPTLLSAAGYKNKLPRHLDGFDQWQTLSLNGPQVRNEILHSIEPVEGSWAIRVGDMKLIYAPEGSINLLRSNYFSPNQAIINLKPDYKVPELEGEAKDHQFVSDIEDVLDMYRNTKRPLKKTPFVVQCGQVPADVMTNCAPAQAPCLFNITADPCEYHNLASAMPEIVSELIEKIQMYNATAVPIRNRDMDPKSDPALGDGSWKPWLSSEPDN